MKQETKGISLIVLVITIIIIIILAGAVILSLNNSSIIAKTKEAKESNDFTSIREALELEKSNVNLDQGKFTSTNAAIVTGKIPSNYSSEIVVTGEGTIIIKGVATGTTSKIKDIPGAIEKLGAVYIPYGFTASTVAGEMSKEGGLVIYEGALGNPSQTSVNQFVWVPVENYSEFVRQNFSTVQSTMVFLPVNTTYAKVSDKYYEVDKTENLDTTTGTAEEAVAMYDSVKKYKGFYIARYEAASSDSTSGGTVISRKYKTPWANIAWGDTGTDSNGLSGIPNATGAVGKSRAMYSASTSVQSTLIYGVQWDAVMRWYRASGINVQNGTGRGNFTGYVGSTGYYKEKNICDMTGNLYELTMEAYGTSCRVMRGCCYANAPDAPTSSRGGYSSFYAPYTGFRPTLYIK